MTMRRAGYAPLESAGEYVCECLRDGDRVFPKWHGELGERIVRCVDCAHWQNSLCWRQAYDATDELGNDYVECVFHTDACDFCSMGELREG